LAAGRFQRLAAQAKILAQCLKLVQMGAEGAASAPFDFA
jgi:hypothetical protein